MESQQTRFYFLKLGGSLITDKNTPYTPRPKVLQRLSEEIREGLSRQPDLRLVIGHGAGSFGHVPAKKYATRRGVHTPAEWLGFAEVWKEAAALHRLVMDALLAARLPAIGLPPSASVTARDGKVAAWDLNPIRSALAAGLVPVVFGDVIFDLVRGGTILSTEDLFEHLARQLQPRRILLAGIEDGVWADFPHCTQLIESITPRNYSQVTDSLSGSQATDVTGGMASKVQQNLELVREIASLEVLIFSGMKAGNVLQSLKGELLGTCIRG